MKGTTGTIFHLSFVIFSVVITAKPVATLQWKMRNENDKWKDFETLSSGQVSCAGWDRQECLSYLVMPCSFMQGLIEVITMPSITSIRQASPVLSLALVSPSVWYQT